MHYDFSKYVALKSVDSSITTLTINYAVVDANNEYQSVFVELDDNLDNVSRYYLNKNEIVYTIRDLMVDHNYTLSFGYKLVGSDEEVVEDVVNVKTKAPTCSMRVTKLSSTSLTYNIKISSEYTQKYLHLLKCDWNITNKSYIKKLVAYMKKVNFI